MGGTLYGTTSQGGADGGGTVFTVTTAGAERLLYSFTNAGDGSRPLAGLINVGSVVYGTTVTGGAYGYGTVFSVTTAGAERVVYSFKGGSDGANPQAGLIKVGGMLYSTTCGGGYAGGNGPGTVFAVTTAGAEKVVYSFKDGIDNDGANPEGGLIDVGGTLYGTTFQAGAYGAGTVFAMTTAGAERVAYTFMDGGDGGYPRPA